MVNENDLAQFFMAIMNLNNDFMKWEKYSARWSIDQDNETADLNKRRTNGMKQRTSDHTQVFKTIAPNILIPC